MRRNFNDLHAFLLVAQEGSFTKAAARLGISQSALSHTLRGLESRLGIRLLTRTTRHVKPTEAGERLLRNIGPLFDGITSELDSLSDLRDKPAGTLRINASEHAVTTILWPKLKPLMNEYPEIKIELMIDNGLTNIVSERFDAGVRLGEQLADGMIGLRIGPDLRMAVVGSPSYWRRHDRPDTPHALVGHDCINLRMPTHGDLYVWEFSRDGQDLNVRVEGRLTVNNARQGLQAAVDGYGLAFVMEDQAQPLIEKGHLVRVLEDWCPWFSGHYLYYPSRRQSSRAFQLLLEALRTHS